MIDQSTFLLGLTLLGGVLIAWRFVLSPLLNWRLAVLDKRRKAQDARWDAWEEQRKLLLAMREHLIEARMEQMGPERRQRYARLLLADTLTRWSKGDYMPPLSIPELED